jgi:tRNA pseudouridine55 synthase
MLGVALIDKPQGLSSHDAIYRVRRALGIRKIGHAGTLDPNATGLLVMAIGDATRFLPYLQLEPKVYEGVAKLGVSTTTQDSEGEVVQSADAGHVTLEQLKSQVGRLTGEIEQIPPMYSAVQVDGQRLYKLARKGETVERKPRRVTVHEFRLVSLDDGLLSFRVVCSGGTYVRTLAHDLGEAAGVGAHLVSLRRVSMGAFDVSNACSPEDVTVDRLLALEDALAPMPAIRLGEDATELARHGGEFSFAGEVPGDKLALLDDGGVYAVAVRIAGATWRPERVLPPKAGG